MNECYYYMYVWMAEEKNRKKILIIKIITNKLYLSHSRIVIIIIKKKMKIL